MSLVEHAKRELDLAGWDADDSFARMMRRDVLAMVEAFAEQGHSGMSAGVAISLIAKLLNWEPLTPLTGEDDEWRNTGTHNGMQLFQNKRCTKLFKDVKEGEPDKAYLVEHYVFTDDNGSTSYTCGRSTLEGITFPFTVPAQERLPYDDKEFLRRKAAGMDLLSGE